MAVRKDEKWLSFLRNLDCLACGARGGEAHHLTVIKQERGMGMKAGDNWAVPICRKCHSHIHDTIGDETLFWALRGIDPVAWCEKAYSRREQLL